MLLFCHSSGMGMRNKKGVCKCRGQQGSRAAGQQGKLLPSSRLEIAKKRQGSAGYGGGPVENDSSTCGPIAVARRCTRDGSEIAWFVYQGYPQCTIQILVLRHAHPASSPLLFFPPSPPLLFFSCSGPFLFVWGAAMQRRIILGRPAKQRRFHRIDPY